MKRVVLFGLVCACGPTSAEPATASTTTPDATSTTTGDPDSTTLATTTATPTTSSATTGGSADTTATGTVATTSGASADTTATGTVATTTGETAADMTTTGTTTDASTTDHNVPCEEMMLSPDPPDGCIVPLDAEPGFPDLIEVFIDDTKIPRITDCAGEDGWTYVHPRGPYDVIEVCGPACEALQLGGAIEVHFFCIG